MSASDTLLAMNDGARRDSAGPLRIAIGTVAGALLLVACERGPAATKPAVDPIDTSTTASAPEARRGYEIPIPQLEFWAGTQVPKFRYEMRFDPAEEPGGSPRLHRNGWASAYYGSGVMEREGAYRYDAALGRSERVGVWTYYTQDGKVERTEDRGGEVIWTAPDQLIAPPGTTP